MSSRDPAVVVLGGGLAGVGCAWALASAGVRDITVIERGPELGGLAGSFERDGRFYPIGYHHILQRDSALLCVLDRLGSLGDVRWRRVRMLFHSGGSNYDLSDPRDLLRFPLPFTDKLRFVALMLRAFAKRDWSDWEGRSARELLDQWAGPRVREAFFEPLTQLKFELPCSEISAAWVGRRLSYREGSAPLGFIPGTNWTSVLCRGMAAWLTELGVQTRLSTNVVRLHTEGTRVVEAELSSGERVRGDCFIAALPTDAYQRLAPREETAELASIRYSSLISVVCASRKKITPDFYWLNLASLDRQACAVFLLSSLNPTIGAHGDACVNFVTHACDRRRALLALSDRELIDGYLADFKALFGFDLDPYWTQVSRVGSYSPVFQRGYRNPPPRSRSWPNVLFAGNSCTYPSVASTGTAIQSGVAAARLVLREHGRDTDLPEKLASFRLRSMPRATRA